MATGQVGWRQRINNVARMKIDPQEGSPVGKVQYLEIKIAKKILNVKMRNLPVLLLIEKSYLSKVTLQLHASPL